MAKKLLSKIDIPNSSQPSDTDPQKLYLRNLIEYVFR